MFFTSKSLKSTLLYNEGKGKEGKCAKGNSNEFGSQMHMQRNNVVYWKTKRKIRSDLQCMHLYIYMYTYVSGRCPIPFTFHQTPIDSYYSQRKSNPIPMESTGLDLATNSIKNLGNRIAARLFLQNLRNGKDLIRSYISQLLYSSSQNNLFSTLSLTSTDVCVKESIYERVCVHCICVCI